MERQSYTEYRILNKRNLTLSPLIMTIVALANSLGQIRQKVTCCLIWVHAICFFISNMSTCPQFSSVSTLREITDENTIILMGTLTCRNYSFRMTWVKELYFLLLGSLPK